MHAGCLTVIDGTLAGIYRTLRFHGASIVLVMRRHRQLNRIDEPRTVHERTSTVFDRTVSMPIKRRRRGFHEACDRGRARGQKTSFGRAAGSLRQDGTSPTPPYI